MLVLLVHPGGPFWKNKDAGAGPFPKANTTTMKSRSPQQSVNLRKSSARAGRRGYAARRIRQKAGKVVTAFALEGDFDCDSFKCNSFEMEWPPKSGKRASFPEIDQAQWFSLDEARRRINPAQAELIDRLEAALATSSQRNPARA